MLDNVVLVGMPGAGKSTVGVLLAKALGAGYIDTDLLIQRRYDTLLQDIINSRGVGDFLDIEQQTVLDIVCSRCVIATGGSVVERAKGMDHLRSLGPVVFIDVPLKLLRSRIKNMRTRGIAMSPDETLDDIFARRLPLYRKYSDITAVVTADSDIESVITDITHQLELFPRSR